MEFATYITGFVDGEGTFSISFNFRSKLKTNIEVRPSFSISQHKRNLEILKRIKNYFNVGGIRFSKRDQNYKYETRSIRDLINVIIPHFKKYQLLTSKRNDFTTFAYICEQINSNHHLNRNNLKYIIDLAYTMNKAGKRRYCKQKLLRLMAR